MIGTNLLKLVYLREKVSLLIKIKKKILIQLQNNFGNANFKNKILKTNFISYITIYI